MMIDGVAKSVHQASIDFLKLPPSPAGWLGGVLAALGALGVVLATPTAAVAAVAIKRLYIDDILESGDPLAEDVAACQSERTMS